MTAKLRMHEARRPALVGLLRLKEPSVLLCDLDKLALKRQKINESTTFIQC